MSKYNFNRLRYIIPLLIMFSPLLHAQDKVVIFKKDKSKIEITTPSIDSISFPTETTMRIHNWNATVTDFFLADIDSIKTIIDQGTAQSDRAALIAFYKATDGSNWKNNTNWCSDKPLNEWFGVSTNTEGRVIKLILRENNLNGPISSGLGQMTKLITLDLISNKLSGKIPPEFGNLSNLYQLNLVDNLLSGELPVELGKLKKTWSLLLTKNELSGTIPIELRFMKNLRDLCLDLNQLTGSIPTELSELSNLEWLYLGYNQLTGTVPKELAKLSKLSYFFLSTNQLTGTLHPDLAQLMTKMQYFDIMRNKFSGPLPLALVNHPKWNKFAWYTYPWNNFDRAPVFMDDFIAKDIQGDTIDFKKIRQKNKLTLVFAWQSWCSFQFFELMRAVYEKYSTKGLGIIAFNRYDNENVELVKSTIDTYKLNWINAIETKDNGVPYFKDLIDNTGVFVTNQYGEILFSSFLWDKAYDVEKFIEKQLGPAKIYESSDFSKDGMVTQLQKASAGKGVDLILMGDGFVDTTFVAGGIYEKRMKDAMEHYFSIEPTKSYRDYFNVYMINAVSKHGIFSDSATTALRVKFGDKTFVSGNFERIRQYAGKVLEAGLSEKQIICVINSPKYAGTCYLFDDASIAFTPMVAFDQNQFAAVIHHEAVGHGLGKLGDEYVYNYGVIDDTNRANLLAAQSNGSFQNLSLSPTNLPWSHFIGKTNYSMVGAFEGGFFFSNGVWRAEQNNCMINNIPYFNGPSREQIVKRILQAAGQTYTWADFVAKDKYAPYLKSAILRTQTEDKNFAPPVFMNRNLFE